MGSTFAPIKSGETFAFTVTITDSTNALMTGMASRLESHVRDQYDVLVADLSIRETDEPGVYLFTADSTEDWPADVLYFDIRYKEPNGRTIHSQTLTFQVERSMTHA